MSSLAPDDDVYEDDEAERLRPLEDRLRRLAWPQPPAGVRERTLEKLRRQLIESNGFADDGVARDDADARRDRH